MGYFSNNSSTKDESTLNSALNDANSPEDEGYVNVEEMHDKNKKKSSKKSTKPTTEKMNTNNNSCCGSMRAAVSHPAFSQTEVTGQQIHGPKTFAPASVMSLATKTVFMGWSVSLGVMEFMERESQPFFFAYLTDLTLVVSSVYFTLSWFQSLYAMMRPSVHESPTVSKFQMVTWALYAMAAPAEVVVTAGYWGMDWDRDIDSALDYYNLSVHGGILMAMLVEGMMINRVPLRIRHFGLVLTYMTGYLIWTVVHALLGLGDPESEDDDNLYSVLRWNEAPWTTTGYAAVFLFVLSPASFMMVYWMSLPWRRYSYVNNNSDDSEAITSYVELNRMRGGRMA